ncbi:MAG: hypothetical protein ACJAQT_000671 [Akkermansiaceae bacterium]
MLTAPLAISNLQADPTSGDVTLTWNSQPGATYSILGSENLLADAETNDSVASQGTTTTLSFNDTSMIDKPRYFFHTFKGTSHPPISAPAP